MQNKSLILWFFKNIGQYLCPKNAFIPNFISLKIIIYKKI